jgi:aerobic-type carbon monoxide dehydrogenase small subunit (CoxS/CutS family)
VTDQTMLDPRICKWYAMQYAHFRALVLQGGCGVCTVMLTYVDASGNQASRAINSCLRPLCSVDGMAITTIEGIGNAKDGYHALQQKLAACNGSQCGAYNRPELLRASESLLLGLLFGSSRHH